MARRRRYYDDYYDDRYPAYTSVASREKLAQKEMTKRRKRGAELHPVKVQGLKIARTFWGKEWCANLESYRDYENRLPRGRTYVRHGSVIDLQIQAGKVEALVVGRDGRRRVVVEDERLSDERSEVDDHVCPLCRSEEQRVLLDAQDHDVLGVVGVVDRLVQDHRRRREETALVADLDHGRTPGRRVRHAARATVEHDGVSGGIPVERERTERVLG